MGEENARLKDHKRVVHYEVVETPCPECGKVYPSKFKMEQHMQAHDMTTEGTFKLVQYLRMNNFRAQSIFIHICTIIEVD